MGAQAARWAGAGGKLGAVAQEVAALLRQISCGSSFECGSLHAESVAVMYQAAAAGHAAGGAEVAGVAGDLGMGAQAARWAGAGGKLGAVAQEVAALLRD
ncbi:hypothetical protein OEZ85_004796 [Tetradesmus obliquus]|uniref:DhaL domain-containing protein n=1 Tax=Tetradesmus obliquus TaxID=3088 RepID=A0ABY8UL82_TETOB|nr:hypothetical protein OEZ85_004796 [Tetradesmus obliquus]